MERTADTISGSLAYGMGNLPGRGMVGILARSIGKSDKETKLLLEERQSRGRELVEALKRNRDQSAAENKVPFPVEGFCLPLEGMTDLEIARRAQAGDGDACLKRVQSFFQGDRGWMEFGWREKKEMEKWLNLAILYKRPGADFLKNLFSEVWAREKPMYRDEVNEVALMTLEMQDVPGYDAFLKRLKDGDYLLYRTAAYLRPPGLDAGEDYSVMYETLREGARKGKVEFQRHLAALCFEEKKFFYYYPNVFQEFLEKKDNWEERLNFLPDSAREFCIGMMRFSGILNINSGTALSVYREAASYALQAACRDDLTGMYLWMRYGLRGMDRLSRTDWENVSKFDFRLIESGYAPYLMKLNRYWQDGFMGSERTGEAILEMVYPPAIYEERLKRNGFKEGWDISSWRECLDRGETGSYVKKAVELGQTDHLLTTLAGRDFTDYSLWADAPQEVRARLLEQVEEWASEGDIHAMYWLAGIYEKGIGVTVNRGRAYALYGKAMEEGRKYPFFFISVRNGLTPGYDKLPLLDAARIKRAEMIWTYADFPGRDEKTAFRELLIPCGHWLAPNYIWYCLGMFYERGIGGAADCEKALEFYRKGSSRHEGCRQGVERLTSRAAEKK